MSGGPIDPAKTALVTIDLTNDFLHPDGAYGRAGQGTLILNHCRSIGTRRPTLSGR